MSSATSNKQNLCDFVQPALFHEWFELQTFAMLSMYSAKVDMISVKI